MLFRIPVPLPPQQGEADHHPPAHQRLPAVRGCIFCGALSRVTAFRVPEFIIDSKRHADGSLCSELLSPLFWSACAECAPLVHADAGEELGKRLIGWVSSGSTARAASAADREAVAGFLRQGLGRFLLLRLTVPEECREYRHPEEDSALMVDLHREMERRG